MDLRAFEAKRAMEARDAEERMRHTLGRIGGNEPMDVCEEAEKRRIMAEMEQNAVAVEEDLTELQMVRERMTILLGRLDGTNEQLGHAVTRLVGQEPSALDGDKAGPRGQGLVNEILSLVDAAHDHLSLIEEKSERLTRI